MRRTDRLLLALGALVVAAGCHRVPPLLAPNPKGLDRPAPDSFVVRLETTKGAIDLMVHRDWSPRGADRLHWLVQHGYYDGARFFRAVSGFVVQFGLAADPRVTAAWRPRRIADDSVVQPNRRGRLSFATSGPNTRTAQLFINLGDNAARLDRRGFSPLGEVVDGMAVVDSLYQGYGEGPPAGSGPSQGTITTEGEAYLAREFPKLDQIRKARVIRSWR